MGVGTEGVETVVVSVGGAGVSVDGAGVSVDDTGVSVGIGGRVEVASVGVSVDDKMSGVFAAVSEESVSVGSSGVFVQAAKENSRAEASRGAQRRVKNIFFIRLSFF